MVQTPQQRRANEAFAKKNANQMGKPVPTVVKKQAPSKSPVSKIWVFLLIFVVCGGLIFEALRIMFGFGS